MDDVVTDFVWWNPDDDEPMIDGTLTLKVVGTISLTSDGDGELLPIK